MALIAATKKHLRDFLPSNSCRVGFLYDVCAASLFDSEHWKQNIKHTTVNKMIFAICTIRTRDKKIRHNIIWENYT